MRAWSELVSGTSLNSGRVRLLDLCSRRWFRFARRRMILWLPVTRKRFDAPEWLFALPGDLALCVSISRSLVGRAVRVMRLLERLTYSGAPPRHTGRLCGAMTIVMLRPSCLGDAST